MKTLDLRERARSHALSVAVRPELRTAAIATWHGRMTNEYQSSYVFEALAEQAKSANFGGDLAARAREFAAEERRHGELCAAVVHALGGEAITTVEDQPLFPRHWEVGSEEAILRNVLSIGCLSETVAVSLIGAEREEMPEGPLRDLLTGIWADEVGHARFGWQLLSARVPKLDLAARRRMTAYLRVAFRHLEEHELAHLPEVGVFGEGSREVGLCNGADARTLFFATVRRVIVPRLSRLGLAAEWAYQHRHALRAADSQPALRREVA